ncbi:sigma-70 family RNA polymerase sigma factor [Cytophagaceae bacterium YF14B1]|uniref:Sigma-70 family RNA polymerase sigma factor n=1 Tax=Xanthocytophaga flava TaxID=3048013 RepID=A0AAE3QTZ0_9BACT|nr:sigma-70 family RNA polymerase sigma factor [Xanthocytophaga flavus]MDJ1484911.1 sigma-70 family RNA polymerase sigma factor [Xanthocytophaga flavus]
MHRSVSPINTENCTSEKQTSDELCFLDQFYVTHRVEFLKWAYKHYSLSPEEAIDIYQDAVIVLFENYQKGKLQELRSTVKTYFYGIAKNLIYVYLKKRTKQKNHIGTFSELDTLADTISSSDPHNDWFEETIDVINETVQKLSSKGQTIIQLFYYEKKSLREITKILGYNSEDVVKTTKMRYKKLLKQMVQEELNKQYAA